MIERLIANNMLHELNYDNIPNAKNVMEKFQDSAFDPGNQHSIPYMWGTVGILYNTTMVNGTIDSWDALFDAQYAKKILMYDSARDSLMVGLIKNGLDINSRSEADLKVATDTLIAQKPLVMAYVMDEVKDKMIAGEAALALVYSGYVIDAIEENPDLAYVIPKEGSNVWMDSMVIPATSEKTQMAEQFINFMCRPDIAMKNIEYVAYSTPNQATYDMLDEQMQKNPVAYPSAEELSRCIFYHDLGDYNEKYDEAWLKIKTSN
jgi:spermidine/putrescine-binding protein